MINGTSTEFLGSRRSALDRAHEVRSHDLTRSLGAQLSGIGAERSDQGDPTGEMRMSHRDNGVGVGPDVHRAESQVEPRITMPRCRGFDRYNSCYSTATCHPRHAPMDFQGHFVIDSSLLA